MAGRCRAWYVRRMDASLLLEDPAPRNDNDLFDYLPDFVKQRAQLWDLISGIEAMQPQYDIPYFDTTTEETVAGLRDRVARLDWQIASRVQARRELGD